MNRSSSEKQNSTSNNLQKNRIYSITTVLCIIHYTLTMSSSIPILNKQNDIMTHGLNFDNLAASAKQTHYVDIMQQGKHPSPDLTSFQKNG